MSRFINCSIFLLLFYCKTVAQENTSDGPYVFYNGDKVVVKSLINDSLRINSFPVKEKSKHELTVHFSDHPDWNFSFTLHHEITSLAYIYPAACHMVAFSDIEAEFEPFRAMLINNKIIDEKYNWIFGKGLLVIAGDLFDRGNEVTSYLWLLYKLEDETEAAGGAVHVILGNHEIMNLSGDTRYVQPKYFDNAARKQTAFNDLFKDNTELGRWLRSKNVIEKIGDLLVLHGGISPIVLAKKISIDSMNAMARPWYDQSRSENLPENLQDLFNSNSPFWYRGYFLDPKATDEQIENTLRFYNCKKIIVGHDIVDSITPLYRGKVIGIDVNEHEGILQGLLIEKKHYYIIDRSGKKRYCHEIYFHSIYITRC